MENRVSSPRSGRTQTSKTFDASRKSRRRQRDTASLETLVEILRELRRLQEKAARNDLPMIAYLLDMAALEAERLACRQPK